jgi:hypothetical protein
MNIFEFEKDNGQIIEFVAETQEQAIKAFKNYNKKNVPTVTSEKDKVLNEFAKEEVANKSISQSVKESFYNRPTFQALGGAAGIIPSAIAGAAVGSVVPGIGNIIGGITGGVLGGLAGGQVYDITQSIATGKEQKPSEQYKQLGKDLKSEVAYNLAGASIPGVAGAVRRGLGGATESAKKIYEAGVRTNVPQSLVTASDSKLVAGYNRVLGVFPLTGGPIRTEAAKRTASINALANDTLNAFGPNASITDLGVDMTTAAKNSYSKFRLTSSSLYDDFIESTKQLDDPKIFQLTNAKEAVEIIETGIKSPVDSPRSDAVLDFLRQIKEIPGKIDPQQYRSLQADINFLMRKGGKEGLDIKRLRDVKKALEKDFSMPVIGENVLSVSPSGAIRNESIDAVLQSHKIANDFYAEGMAKFASPTAKKFKQIDKNIFGAGAEIPGTINADQLAKKVLKIGSPQSLQQLRGLVGDKVYKTSVKSLMDDAFDKATKSTPTDVDLKFDVNKLKKELGFIGQKSENFEGLKELLKGTDVSFQQFSDFLTVAQAHTDTFVPNLSQFIARRVGLGGARSLAAIAGAGGAVAGVATAPFTTLGILYTSRMGSKLIANPKNLELANTLLDFRSPRMLKWQRAMRGITQLISDKDITDEDKEALSIYKEEIKKLKPGRKLP